MNDVKQLGHRVVTTAALALAAIVISLTSLRGAMTSTDLDPLSSALTKADTMQGILAIVGFGMIAFLGVLLLMLRDDMRRYTAACDRHEAQAATETAA